MNDSTPSRSVWLFKYCESYDDPRAAFTIDQEGYSSPEHAQSVVEAASAALRRIGVIFEVELSTRSSLAPRPDGPTWEEFKQRHFVDGVPLAVRPRPKEPGVPPSWDAMNAELARGNVDLRDELVLAVNLAFPGGRVAVTADRGPLRRTAASVDWSEEKFGFEVAVAAVIGEADIEGALSSVRTELGRVGWILKAAHEGGGRLSCDGHRGDFRIWMDAAPGTIEVCGYSPLYRSPADADSTWVTEPRPISLAVEPG
jgi:hypothetical protein